MGNIGALRYGTPLYATRPGLYDFELWESALWDPALWDSTLQDPPTYGILRYGNLRYQSDEGNYNHVITMGLRRRKHIYRYHDVRDEEETARRKTNLLSDRL